jgi:hypothetical protein
MNDASIVDYQLKMSMFFPIDASLPHSSGAHHRRVDITELSYLPVFLLAHAHAQISHQRQEHPSGQSGTGWIEWLISPLRVAVRLFVPW